MLKTIIVILNLLNILAIQCSPIQPLTTCTTSEVTAIKEEFLDRIAASTITNENQILSNENSDDLLSQYQSRVQELQSNLIDRISEEKNRATDASIACLTTVEGFILISQQKVNSKFVSKHSKSQEKVLSTRAKFESKLSDSKVKASKSIEKCTASASSCSAIENCCLIAVNKLDVLKYEVVEAIRKLELKHVQSLDEVYQGAVNVAAHLSNQIVICSPPRPTTTDQVETKETEEELSDPNLSSEEGSIGNEEFKVSDENMEAKESKETNGSNDSEILANISQPGEEDPQINVESQNAEDAINLDAATNEIDGISEFEESNYADDLQHGSDVNEDIVLNNAVPDVDNTEEHGSEVNEEIVNRESEDESILVVNNAKPDVHNAEEQHEGGYKCTENCEYVPQLEETSSQN